MSPQPSFPEAHLVSVHVGRIGALGAESEPSAFVKGALAGPAEITELGVAGDEQADRSVHGGPDMAVYAYPFRHYAAWSADHPELAGKFAAGAFAENLVLDGPVESDVCVGDIHALGEVRLQVCQPRQPCFKLALRFEAPKLPKAMVQNGRSGWYYRVLTPGRVAPGAALTLAARPNPDFAFARLIEIVNHGSASEAELRRMATMEGLAEKLRRKAAESLAG